MNVDVLRTPGQPLQKWAKQEFNDFELITKDLSNILVEFGILWDKIGIINDGKD